MSAPITLRLPYPLSANKYWRPVVIKNHAMIVPTREAKEFKAEIALLAVAAGIRVPLDGRVALRVDLFPDRPQDWAKRAQRNPDTWDDDIRCIDLDNCQKVLIDALNKVAWVDDSQLRRIYLERQEPDQFGARCIVTIGRLNQVPIARDLFAA